MFINVLDTITNRTWTEHFDSYNFFRKRFFKIKQSDWLLKVTENNTQLKQQLKDKDEKINNIKQYLETTYTEWFNWKNDILEILESNKED